MRKVVIVIIAIMINIILNSCTGCSKSGKYKKKTISNTESINNSISERRRNSSSSSKIVINMIKENGVYKIPVLINGSKMDFIFDTGAGLISISNIEASFLIKQGTLSEDDIIGQANFYDANGDISVGTIILLKEVSIGRRIIRNVKASVVDNSVAPLLLGQSALEKFGKFTIDYSDNTLTFE